MHQQEAEAVAPHVGQQVGLARHAVQQLTHLPQYLVTSCLTGPLLELGEVVQIEKEDRDRYAPVA